MSVLQEAVANLVHTARWKPVSPGADGAYVFRLDNELDFTVFSPDGATCILRAEVARLPEETGEADRLLQRCAALAVASCRERRSVLSVQDGALHLHRNLPQHDAVGLLPATARDFLNDLAWWKTQAQQGGRPEFSYSMSFPRQGW